MACTAVVTSPSTSHSTPARATGEAIICMCPGPPCPGERRALLRLLDEVGEEGAGFLQLTTP